MSNNEPTSIQKYIQALIEERDSLREKWRNHSIEDLEGKRDYKEYTERANHVLYTALHSFDNSELTEEQIEEKTKVTETIADWFIDKMVGLTLSRNRERMTKQIITAACRKVGARFPNLERDKLDDYFFRIFFDAELSVTLTMPSEPSADKQAA